MRLRPYWQAGNPVLAAEVAEAARRGASFTFPPRWLARVRFPRAVAPFGEMAT